MPARDACLSPRPPVVNTVFVCYENTPHPSADLKDLRKCGMFPEPGSHLVQAFEVRQTFNPAGARNFILAGSSLHWLDFLHFDQRKLEVSLNTRGLKWLTTSLSQQNHNDLFFYLVPSIPQLRHMSEWLQWQIPTYQNSFNAWLICIMLIRRLKSHQMDDNVSAGVPVIECRLSSVGAERQSITASLENCFDWETETMLRYSDKREALIMF